MDLLVYGGPCHHLRAGAAMRNLCIILSGLCGLAAVGIVIAVAGTTVVPLRFLAWAVPFLAGVVSFLSPCVFPLVPSYVAYVTGMTLEELAADEVSRARRAAFIHSTLFVLGFTLVFMFLGLAVLGLMSWSVGESLCREKWSQKLASLVVSCVRTSKRSPNHMRRCCCAASRAAGLPWWPARSTAALLANRCPMSRCPAPPTPKASWFPSCAAG